ncbi:MAG TPA: phospholipid carrier-dependent glycosyltransferase, partial [Candidatus Latescibacteria bacterium]|nr:phospholipid carrier-dependent glycosyltransferase [Candidatus Latescibacterota bacterium]
MTDSKGAFIFGAFCAYMTLIYCIISSVIVLSVLDIRLTQFNAVLILVFAASLSVLLLTRTKGLVSGNESSPIPMTTNQRLRTALAVAAVMLVVGWVFLVVIAVRLPDFTCDGNFYHIPAIQAYVNAGKVHWIAGLPANLDGYMNGYPKGAEVLSFYIVTLLQSDSSVNLANVLFLPMGVLGIATVCGLLGIDFLVSFCIGLLWVTIPVNIFQSATAYVDSAFASAVVGAVAAFFSHLVLVDTNRKKTYSVVLLGISLGLALGVKGTGAVVCATVLLAFTIVAVARRVRRRDAGILVESIGVVAVVLVTSLPSGLFWYCRNYAHTGSPVYPAGLTLLGRIIFPGPPVSVAVGLEGQVPEVLRELNPVWRVVRTWLQIAGG